MKGIILVKNKCIIMYKLGKEFVAEMLIWCILVLGLAPLVLLME